MKWISGMAVVASGVSTHSNILSRFRQVPGFGHDTIRKFANNVSELKKLAARDFENLLQVMRTVVDLPYCSRSVSVRSLCSRVFFLNRTTRPFFVSFSSVHNGTALQSYACTTTTP
jgi:hypothetical protein